MTPIKISPDLINKNNKPPHKTKNKQNNLSDTCIGTYFEDNSQLYKLIDEGLKAMENKKVRPFEEALSNIQKKL